jgi:hypothetical protein
MEETQTKAPPESPYVRRPVTPGADFRSAPAQATAAPTPEELKAFVDKVTDAEAPTGAGKVRMVDEATGEIKEQAATKDPEAEMTDATLAKVLAFLDPSSRGPITLLVARHKLFAMRIPTQQEILDVTAVTGVMVGTDMNAAQSQWSIIGELRKAVYGWVPEQSPAAQLLRANIAWPKKWPPLNDVHWTDSRDPYLLSEEILPLWAQYLTWREAVVPTRAEIDFYWASQR